MILFLTYHKVLRGPESKPEFYTVRAGQLQRHLELLAQSELRPLTLRELLDYGPLSRAAFPSSPYAGAAAVPFMLTFDDATLDHYEVVFPLLQAAGRHGIFFVPTGKLNRPGYLTNPMVQEMAKAGHTIGLHGHEHRRLDELNEEDIRVQMEVSRAIIEDLTGTRPVIFATPGGFTDWRVQAMAMETGVRAIRTMRWGYNRLFNLAALECIPFNRNSTEADFHRALEFRSQALAYAAKQVARKLVPKALYGPLRETVSRVRGK